MDASLVFSIAFFTVFILYSIFGGYILYKNPKNSLNIVFFIVCILLCIWSLGFSFEVSAPNAEMAIFWNRIASIGWGALYSLLLHFFLILTGKKTLLKKWWVYLMLYLPAIVTIYFFSIPTEFNIVQNNLIHTDYGWVNATSNGIRDKFFRCYYMIFTLTGLVMVGVWGKKSSDSKNKKQAKLILTSFIFPLVMGTITDQFVIPYINIPQIAPILIIVPIYVVYYSIKRYGLMTPQQVDKNEMILNEHARVMVYNYISIAYMTGGLIYFFTQYILYKNELKSVPLFGFLFLIIGIAIQLVQHLRIKENTKDIVNLWIIVFSIPIITLRFLHNASITIWAFPIIIIIFSLVFNKRYILMAVAISTLFTQVIVWVLMPHAVVTINAVEYVKRIVIIIFAMGLAFFVNKVYIKRLEENNKQVKVQKFISEISSDFIAVSQSNLEEKINNLVVRAGEIFTADRSYVFLFDMAANTMSCISEWCNDGILPEISNFHDMPLEDYTWRMNQLENSQIVQIEKVFDLPEEAKILKTDLERQGVQSTLSIPIGGSQKLFGFFGIDFIHSLNKWSDEQIDILKIVVNILSDALKKVDAENEISFMAYHDYLSGLPNRRLFNDSLNQAINLAKRTVNILGVIFVDLDSFKVINDSLGHEGGDLLLKIVSEKLFNVVRHSGTVSRFGGDEFLIMINHLSNENDIINIADKIMSIFDRPFIVKGQEFYLTTSAGIAIYPFDGMDADNLIKNADIAMYKAKEKGKNQYILCSSELKNELTKKINIINSLYRALERDEFYINYQPQVELSTGEIIGLEALIRWKHPELGLISPAVFIPIAEQIGLINEIGEWVLKTACEQNKKWQTAGYNPVCMAVNVSANQLRNPNIIEQIKDVITVTELNPAFMELEITESVAMNEINYIVELLSSIKKLGILISIDDFGTGYSSLGRLKVLPIDKIKIDKQFIDGIEESEKDKAIVRTIINLAKNLGLKVIAEGVENENQLKFLKQELCNEVQGYYYYKPMSAEDVERILQKNNH